jgi:hypothetical protein
MRLFETTTVVSALCLGLALSSAQQGPPVLKPPEPETKTTTMQALIDEMQGAWRLTEFSTPLFEKKNRVDVGYLLVSGNYFSLEIHVGWMTSGELLPQRSFASGTHRFEMDERCRMTSSSVIGASIPIGRSMMDPPGTLAFEAPGFKRMYDVVCLGNTMTFKRDDGAKMTFERLNDSLTRRDIYGRPIKPKDPNEPKKEGAPDKKDAPPKKN